MSDKFRKVYPIEVKFGDGDLPSSSKLAFGFSQTRNGLGIIERAIGDIWNQSGDSVLSPGGNLLGNALYVTNIGRALGAQKFLSPRVPSLAGIEKYRDTIVARDGTNGNTENYLRYTPVPAGGALASSDFTVTSSTPASRLTTFVTSPGAVDADGKWHVTAGGKLISYQPITAADITYKPAPIPDIDTVAQSTVIPDPDSIDTTFGGLKICYANGTDNSTGYWIFLPPRRPLNSGRKIGTSPNETNNQVSNASPRYFFQDPASAPSVDAHYRYRFPTEIQASLDGGSAIGLPDNFIYILDKTLGTIVEGVSFSVDTTAPNSNGRYVVKAQGTKLDELLASDGTLLTSKATDLTADYKTRLALICPGTNLARNISAVVAKTATHSHTGVDGSQPVLHKNLLDLYNQDTIKWIPSGLRGDDHPQYLHREGMNVTRDLWRGGMRGDLLLNSTNSTSNFFNSTGDSQKLYFGHTDNAIYYQTANSAITVSTRDFRLDTAGQKVQFGSSSIFLDQDRVNRIWVASQFQKVYGADASGSQSSSTAAALATIAVTIPTGFLGDVALVDSGWMQATTGTNVQVAYQITLDSTTLTTPIQNTLPTAALPYSAGTAVEFTGLSGAHTFRFMFKSDGTNTVTVVSRLVVTVTLRAT
jgi:hypothetical protein